MESIPPTTEQFVAITMRAFDLMGGVERANANLQAESNARKARWNQDTEMIGRILRAHLYLEYYMTEHLRYENPGIGDLDSARLTFSQKVALLRVDDEATKSLAHGIRHLNKIRNKLAHNLSIVVTKDDADIFLSVRVFKLIRDAVATHTTTSPSNAPLDVLEAFAECAATLLHRNGRSFEKALEQAVAEWKATNKDIPDAN